MAYRVSNHAEKLSVSNLCNHSGTISLTAVLLIALVRLRFAHRCWQKSENFQLFCNNSADKPRFAHAKNDSLAAGLMQQIKHLKAIVDMIGRVNYLWDGGWKRG